MSPLVLYGLRITESLYCLEDSDVRAFKVSRHRSRRLHKKLCRRFGGEFIKKPAVFRTPAGIICHPALYVELVKRLQQVAL